MIGMGSSSSRNQFPSWTAPFTRYAFTGQTPDGVNPATGTGAGSGYGLINDAYAGSGAFPAWDAFSGLAGQVPAAQQAGQMGQQLGAQATQQGYGNLSQLAGMGWGPLGQSMGIAGMVPQGMDASNYYLQGVTGAANGGNVQGAMGAGQQVVDAALSAYRALPAEAYQRVVQEGLPEVRAASSARGLGSSGQAARNEEDYIQRTRDDLYQKDVANQIAALGTGAAASGAAASQAIGAQNAAIGRGQLGMQAANAIPGIMGAFQDVTGQPLGMMGQMAAMQGLPLDLVNQGLSTFASSLGLPLQYQQALYNYTRQPQLDLLSQLTGTQTGQSRGWNASIGGGSKGGGGSGGGSN
jgi:hypothetical protein